MTLTSRIDSGKYTLINSGEVLPAERNDTLEINFSFENGKNSPFLFHLRVEFLANDEKKAQFKVFSDDKTNTLTLYLYNFDDPIGFGNIDLLDIATLGGKKCFLRFFSSKIAPEVGNTFKYYVYMEK